MALSAYDDQMNLTYFNQTYVEMFDYPKDAVSIGVSIESLIRTLAERGEYGLGDVETIVQERKAIRSQPGKRRIEWLRTSDRVIELFWRQIEGVGHVTVAVDATESSWAIRALRDSEFLLGSVFDHLPVGISMTEPGGRFLMANSTFAVWLNDDAKSIVGKTLFDYYPAQDAERVIAEEMRVLETGEESLSEATHTFPDGNTRSILIHKRPVRLGTETTFAIASVFTDITERMQTEEKLRESEARFRDFAESASDWYWEIDSECRYVDVFDGPGHRTLMSPSWYVGKRVEEVLKKSYSLADWQPFFEAFKERRSYRAAYPFWSGIPRCVAWV